MDEYKISPEMQKFIIKKGEYVITPYDEVEENLRQAAKETVREILGENNRLVEKYG
jgi:hypothetical protein